MSRISKDETIRLSGARWAMEVAKKYGVEVLEEDLKKRGAMGIPLQVNRQDMENLGQAALKDVQKPLLSLMLVTLHDEFGFGHGRLVRCMERFEEKAACLVGDYTTWEEQAEILLKECDIVLEER